MLLKEMYNKYYILNILKYKLIEKKYNTKVINYFNGQINILNKLINKEIFEVLNSLLKEKTNYRVLKNIDKGHQNLVDIINNPEQWKLGLLKDNTDHYRYKEILVFSTERYDLIFGKEVTGQSYITNKWQ